MTAVNRLKMKREERAKQFAPFSALKGYEEALAAKERTVAEPVFMDEEKKDELDRAIHVIRTHDVVTVVWFDGEEYLKNTGMVSRVDLDAGYIKIVNKKIFLDSIVDISLSEK